MSAHQIVRATLSPASRRVARVDAVVTLPTTEEGLRMALIDAGIERDHARIDAITAALARLGRCRPGNDMSMLESERARLLRQGAKA